MSNDSTEPITSTSSTSEASAAEQSTGSTAKKLDTETAATKISSMEDFKEKAPKVYDATILAIAQNITNEMRHHQERLKEIMRRGQQNG